MCRLLAGVGRSRWRSYMRVASMLTVRAWRRRGGLGSCWAMRGAADGPAAHTCRHTQTMYIPDSRTPARRRAWTRSCWATWGATGGIAGPACATCCASSATSTTTGASCPRRCSSAWGRPRTASSCARAPAVPGPATLTRSGRLLLPCLTPLSACLAYRACTLPGGGCSGCRWPCGTPLGPTASVLVPQTPNSWLVGPQVL